MKNRIVYFLKGAVMQLRHYLSVGAEYLAPHVEKLAEGTNTGLDFLLEKIQTKDHSLKAGFGKPSKYLSTRNSAYILDGKRAITPLQARNNTLVIAPSGAGKSQVVVFPSILKIAESGASMLINDPHGELSSTIPYLTSQGYKIIQLAFGQEGGDTFYNPILRCQSKTEVNKVAQLLVKKGLSSGAKQGQSSSSGDYFTIKAIELTGMMMNYLREHQPIEYYTLSNVYHLLQNFQARPEAIKQLLMTAKPYLKTQYLSFAGTGKDTLSSIISTAQGALAFIGNDDQLAKLTSSDSIDFNSWRDGKVAVFVSVPIGDSKYYQKIAALFFEQFFQHTFSSLPSGEDKDIYVILDEMGAIAPMLSDFPNVISSGRKFKIPILGVLQSENQLFSSYGKTDGLTILNNFSTKCYFSGLYDEADRLERFLGKFSYSEKLKNGHETTRTRSLMTSDEIRTMPKNQILCLVTGQQPLKLKVTLAYQQPRLMQKLQMTLLYESTGEADGELAQDDIDVDEDFAAAFADMPSIPLLPLPDIANDDSSASPTKTDTQSYREKRQAWFKGKSTLNTKR